MDFSPIKTPQEKEELFFKLTKLRAIQPLNISGDIANHISIIFNKSKKDTVSNIFQLIDTIQDFTEYWNSVIKEYEANQRSLLVPSSSSKKSSSFDTTTASTAPTHIDIDLTSGDWKDHDTIELEEALSRIKQLEEQLSRASDSLVKSQVKCSEYDSLLEKNLSLEKENTELKKKLAGSAGGASLQSKFSEKVDGLFQLKNTFSTLKKSTSTTSFISNISSVASPGALVTPVPPSSASSSITNYNSSFSPLMNRSSTPPPTYLSGMAEEDASQIEDELQQQQQQLQQLQSPTYEDPDQLLLIEIEEFQKQLSSLRHEKNELVNVNMHLDEELHSYQFKLLSTEQQVTELIEENVKLTNLNKSLQTIKQTIEIAKGKVDFDYKNQMKINKVLIATVNKLENDLKEINIKYEIMNNNYQNLQIDYSNNKEQLLRITDQNTLLTQSVSSLQHLYDEKVLNERDINENLEFLQKQLISEKERNAIFKSDYDIIMNEKERIMNVFELTQKKLSQREEQLEELITMGSTTTGDGSLSGNGIASLASRFTITPLSKDGTTSPIPGSGSNLNSKILQFALNARQMSLQKINESSKKFKDVFSSGNATTPGNGIAMTGEEEEGNDTPSSFNNNNENENVDEEYYNNMVMNQPMQKDEAYEVEENEEDNLNHIKKIDQRNIVDEEQEQEQEEDHQFEYHDFEDGDDSSTEADENRNRSHSQSLQSEKGLLFSPDDTSPPSVHGNKNV
jgi:hypothetical protein